MSELLSQGDFTVTRTLDGLIRFICPRSFLVRPETALEIVKVIVEVAGGELIIADPGQTVIRPPGNGNGNGKLIR